MNRLLIIDGMNLVRRLYAAQPDEQDLAGLAQRTLNACQKLCRHHQPSHLAIVWDGEQESWRKQLYPDYKKGRKPMPVMLADYLPQLKQLLATANMHSVNAEAEADDVIATLAYKICQYDGEAIIVSTDKGFSQLQFKGVQQWDHFANSWLDIEALEQKLGIGRHQLLDFMALSGDSGNRIPGIPGIGPKSAAELLKSFRSLANIYNALDKLGQKQAEKLRSGYDMARLSYRLAKLRTDLELHLNLSQYRWAPQNS
ncbi:flap endonuclease Xni [Shewanella sp. A32]|uniref:flap endonuclease Xni n=1 Tax=Shewanella sp. A32 TaxID=3031327 RepID=UPI0023B9F806|nr:flap endonuclease Xni [Shewanella sp. A32]MDF0534525.1 flap endonuclease Xni [Shewanella sp. A32]